MLWIVKLAPTNYLLLLKVVWKIKEKFRKIIDRIIFIDFFHFFFSSSKRFYRIEGVVQSELIAKGSIGLKDSNKIECKFRMVENSELFVCSVV